MASLDVDSLFTNTPIEDTIDICTNILLANTERVKGLLKIQFKELWRNWWNYIGETGETTLAKLVLILKVGLKSI